MTHVDDLLYAGTPKFHRNIIQSITSKFKISRVDSGVFNYLGWQVCQLDGCITVDQLQYGEKVAPVVISPRRKQYAETLLSEEEKLMYQKKARSIAVAKRTDPS